MIDDTASNVSLTAARPRGREKEVGGYRAPRWLPGGHLQTIYAYFLRRTPGYDYRRERWETPDGDFIDLDWLEQPGGSGLVVLFHGLEGCSTSHYAVNLMNQLQRSGFAGVVAHFRGCGGAPNRLARSYHSGDSAEIDWILRRLEAEKPGPLYVVGVSLGAGMLLKWLGEQGDAALRVIERAAAISTPFDLALAARRLDCGWNRLIYTRHFLKTLKRKTLAKIAAHDLTLNPRSIRKASTFRQYDDLYTAPVHGFKDAHDYWTRSSCKPWLKWVAVPTLLINARNDPFFSGEDLPREDEVSAAVSLEFPETGGHVGFVSGTFPGHFDWLGGRLVRFFRGDDEKHDGSFSSRERIEEAFNATSAFPPRWLG